MKQPGLLDHGLHSPGAYSLVFGLAGCPQMETTPQTGPPRDLPGWALRCRVFLLEEDGYHGTTTHGRLVLQREDRPSSPVDSQPWSAL